MEDKVSHNPYDSDDTNMMETGTSNNCKPMFPPLKRIMEAMFLAVRLSNVGILINFLNNTLMPAIN
jgi:hypothetical protein